MTSASYWSSRQQTARTAKVSLRFLFHAVEDNELSVQLRGVEFILEHAVSLFEQLRARTDSRIFVDAWFRLAAVPSQTRTSFCLCHVFLHLSRSWYHLQLFVLSFHVNSHLCATWRTREESSAGQRPLSAVWDLESRRLDCQVLSVTLSRAFCLLRSIQYICLVSPSVPDAGVIRWSTLSAPSEKYVSVSRAEEKMWTCPSPAGWGRSWWDRTDLILHKTIPEGLTISLITPPSEIPLCHFCSPAPGRGQSPPSLWEGPGCVYLRRSVAVWFHCHLTWLRPHRSAPERHSAVGLPHGAGAPLQSILAQNEGTRPTKPPRPTGAGGTGVHQPVPSHRAGGATAALRSGAGGGACDQEGLPGSRETVGQKTSELHGGRYTVTGVSLLLQPEEDQLTYINQPQISQL